VKDQYPYIDTLVKNDGSGQVESGVNDRFYAGSFHWLIYITEGWVGK
jgi:hypothetical protein